MATNENEPRGLRVGQPAPEGVTSDPEHTIPLVAEQPGTTVYYVGEGEVKKQRLGHQVVTTNQPIGFGTDMSFAVIREVVRTREYILTNKLPVSGPAEAQDK